MFDVVNGHEPGGGQCRRRHSRHGRVHGVQSRRAASRWTSAPTSGRSGACFTNCSPAGMRRRRRRHRDAVARTCSASRTSRRCRVIHGGHPTIADPMPREGSRQAAPAARGGRLPDRRGAGGGIVRCRGLFIGPLDFARAVGGARSRPRRHGAGGGHHLAARTAPACSDRSSDASSDDRVTS